MSDETVETGLVTAAVTMPVPVQLGGVPAPAYPKEPLPDGWNLNRVAGLVRDVAQSMYDLPVILKKHKLTQQQYALLTSNEFFKRALEQFTIDWNTAANTQRRLQLEAAIAIEDALPTVAARMHKPTEPLADVVALVKVLAEMAGTIGAKAAQQTTAPGEKFKIIINLGADTLQKEASSRPIEVLAHNEGTGDAQSLQSFLESARVPAKVQPDSEGP